MSTRQFSEFMIKMKQKTSYCGLNKTIGVILSYTEAQHFTQKLFMWFSTTQDMRDIFVDERITFWVKSFPHWAHLFESIDNIPWGFLNLIPRPKLMKIDGTVQWVKIRGFIWVIFSDTMLSLCQYWNEHPKGWSHVSVTRNSKKISLVGKGITKNIRNFHSRH